jgi:hypothetical protein
MTQYITLKSGKKVRIEVMTLPRTRPKTYRETTIHTYEVKKERKSFIIYWHTESDFRSSLSRIKRHYVFTNAHIISVKTRTKKYVDTHFEDKKFMEERAKKHAKN